MTFFKKVIPAWHGINDNNQMKRFSEVQEISRTKNTAGTDRFTRNIV
jgi:hypothetical protein